MNKCYNIIGLDKTLSKDLMNFRLGRAVRHLYDRTNTTCDIELDPEICIVKINNSDITIDVGQILFTIPEECYSMLTIR